MHLKWLAAKHVGSLTSLIHEQRLRRTARGPLEAQAFGLVRLICTGCHTIQPKLTGNCKGKVDVFNLAATRELPALVTSGLSLTLIETAGAGSLAGGCSSSVWNVPISIWNGRVETDALSRFNRTAKLTHTPLCDWFGRSFSIVGLRLKRLVNQRLQSFTYF